VDDSAETAQDAATIIAVLNNDSDPDNDSLAVMVATPRREGHSQRRQLRPGDVHTEAQSQG